MEPPPSSCTVIPVVTFWLGPAFATGGVFVVVMFTVDGGLLRKVLLTTSWAVYKPGRSATKVGLATLVEDSTAMLFGGRLISDH